MVVRDRYKRGRNLVQGRSFLKRDRDLVTKCLLVIQVVYFLWLELQGGSTNTFVLATYGAKVNVLIANGEWCRLITPIFIHIGWTHLLLNSLTLYYVGILVEPLIGSAKFAIIYLLTGVFGNVASFAFNNSISAGASTSLFGLFGLLVAFGRIFPEQHIVRSLSQQFKLLVLVNVFFGFLNQGVDNFGHLGGLISGLMLAWLIVPLKSNRVSPLLRVGLTIGLIGLFILLYWLGLVRVASQN